jgi:arylsulfatase A-like enzyme
MSFESKNRGPIIARVGLVGATVGIAVGLVEAACLRLTDLSFLPQKPHVPALFWFVAPLLAALAFGILGILIGVASSFARNRWIGTILVAGLCGLAGAYLARVLEFTQERSGWFIALRPYVTPAMAFAIFFAWTAAAGLAIWKQHAPLGRMVGLPLKVWSVVVLALMAVLGGGVAVATVHVHLPTSQARTLPPSHSPNIILIVWDTTRADHFSSYGYARETTPNSDQLAQHGVLFENAIASTSWTLPSAASMFTSLLPHQHGASADLPLSNGPKTLAEILSAHGYETAGFNGNPYFGLPFWGLAHGFKTYRDPSNSLGYNLDASLIGRSLLEPHGKSWSGRNQWNQLDAHSINEEVYRWFEHRSDRPYFLFINYMEAHGPYDAPPPYDHRYGQASPHDVNLLMEARLGRLYFPNADREGLIAAYDNALAYIDSQVGELLRNLERSPDWSNTYVILTSDHGEAFGEHGTYGHGWDLYREVLRVPLIIAGPKVPEGVRVPDIVETRQMFSTVLDLSRFSAPAVESASFRHDWMPGFRPTPPDEATVSELLDNMPLPAPQGIISLMTREWHYIYRPGYQRARLYHWTTDPGEKTNLAGTPEVQAAEDALRARTLAIIETSYRPWRDTRYLLALGGANFSPEVEAKMPTPASTGEGQFASGVGVAQSLFHPNPESTTTRPSSADQEMLKGLPYMAQ